MLCLTKMASTLWGAKDDAKAREMQRIDLSHLLHIEPLYHMQAAGAAAAAAWSHSAVAGFGQVSCSLRATKAILAYVGMCVCVYVSIV